MSSSKKRKPETPDQAEREHYEMMTGGQSTGGKRKHVVANRSSTKHRGGAPTRFEQLKQTLYRAQVQQIMKHYTSVLSLSGPIATSLEDDNNNNNPIICFKEALLELGWQYKAWQDLYGIRNNSGISADVIVMGQEDTGQLGLYRGDDAVNRMGVPATVLQERRGQHTIQVGCGGLHSVALTADGKVYTFGCNDDGALGRLWTEQDGSEERMSIMPGLITEMIPASDAETVAKHVIHAPNNESETVVMVSCGDSHTTLLTISGNVYTAGMYKDSDSGKFRDPKVPSLFRPPKVPPKDPKDPKAETLENHLSIKGNNEKPVHVYRMPGRVKFIASGGACNAAILEDDSLVTWGIGLNGELARSEDMVAGCVYKPGDSNQEKKIITGQPVSVDHLDAIFLQVKNGEKTFFDDAIRDKFLNPLPVKFANGRSDMVVTHVAIGESHILVCARVPRESSSRVYSAGNGAYGKLGHGDENPRHALTLIEALKNVPISRVGAGQNHSLFLNTRGDRVYSCGITNYGQLGLSDAVIAAVGEQGGKAVYKPTVVAFPNWTDEKVNEIGRFADVSCGENHNFVTTTTGQLYSWGYGEYGQAGNDPRFTTQDIRQPRLNKTWLDGECHVVTHGAAGGAQHSMVVATRYKKK